MSGIDSGRTVPPSALAPSLASAIPPARPKPDHRQTPHAAPAAGPETVARADLGRGATTARLAVGFLAQAIAQESLLLGARASKAPQKDPVALYRHIQGEASPAPGPQTTVDLKI
jgi:hypothetical protein